MEIEIIVLRHELEILRRQQSRRRLEPADRGLTRRSERASAEGRWPAFDVRPETLLR
jgi:hypothetical protein